ncbi:MAG: methyltransferase domain-containing protein [Verrucomicrobia bacterium]|nr:methyltransferase domain-containing protein [Verrucomicrobiota bacterium]
MADTNWEDRYQRADTPWEKGEPSPGLVDWLAAHPQSAVATVLVPGCGMGHDARAFAAAGFIATGLDIAPSAVRLAREKTTAAGLKADFQPGDFLADKPFARVDWIFEHTCYCAINPTRREDYARAVLRWLKPGGQFLAVHYLIPDTDGPPFGTTRDEVVARFSPRFELLEDWVPRSYPNRTGLERMFWWRRAAGDEA